MKNVFVEGIQGSGKSTMVNRLCELMPQLRVCKEGDYSPVELAWCAWMNLNEYETSIKMFPALREDIALKTVREEDHAVVCYTKIRTDRPGFYQHFEQYEIYNGKKSLEEFKEIVFSRFRRFTEKGYLFECSFFQNIVENLMLFFLLDDDEIIRFYRELFSLIDRKQFLLVYLHSDRLEENIRRIRAERCDEQGREAWYQLMMEYLRKSPYGQRKAECTFDDLIVHLEHRQRLEMRLIDEVIGEDAVVVPSKRWAADASFINRIQ